jgi:Adenylosuccinate synthetase
MFNATTKAVTSARSAGVRSVSTKAAGLNARVCAVLGSQWGDEGKGKLADVLAKK